MFTGIILGRGELAGMQRRGTEMRLSVRALFPLPDLAVGESIAVNGVCLTVEQVRTDGFSAYASTRTISRTSLSGLSARAALNLERALAVGDRLGDISSAGMWTPWARWFPSLRPASPVASALRTIRGLPRKSSPEVQ